MREVTLQFPNIKELIDFTVVASITDGHINRKDFTLSCSLPQADIELARYSFGAILLTTFDFQE